jgi:hypothetical protein
MSIFAVRTSRWLNRVESSTLQLLLPQMSSVLVTSRADPSIGRNFGETDASDMICVLTSVAKDHLGFVVFLHAYFAAFEFVDAGREGKLSSRLCLQLFSHCPPLLNPPLNYLSTYTIEHPPIGLPWSIQHPDANK